MRTHHNHVAGSQTMKRMSWCCAMITASMFTTSGFAAPPKPNPAVQKYIDCINNAVSSATDDKTGKLTNSQGVIASCSKEKQEVLSQKSDPHAARLVANFERHILSRQKGR